MLFAAPFAIVLAYSFLTRGAYGGVEQPWTLENYQRAVRSAVPHDSAALVRDGRWLPPRCAWCWHFPLALFISRAGRAQESVPATGDAAVLDQLPGAHLRLDVSAARHRPDQHRAAGAAASSTRRCRCSTTMARCCWAWSTATCRSWCCRIYATLERLDPSLVEAAADLGARPLDHAVPRDRAALRSPGIVAGSVLVFIPCLGAYLTPDLLGGGRTVLVGNLVQNQFTTARDWPFGSAVSMALMAAGDAAAVVLPAPRKRGPGMKRWLGVYAVAFFAFLHLPLLMLAVFSFNSSRFTVWERFSLDWYRAIFRDPQIVEGTWNSVVIALWATAISTVIGTLCAYGLWKRGSRAAHRRAVSFAGDAGDRDGISLLALFQWAFRWLHWQLGMYTVILAHVAFSIAYVVIVVSARLRTFEPRAGRGGHGSRRDRVAGVLGVTLPALVPGIVAAALLALTVSFDDYVITSMVAGVDSETLPMVIYAMARRGASPVINAISALITVVFGVLILISERVREA